MATAGKAPGGSNSMATMIIMGKARQASNVMMSCRRNVLFTDAMQ